LESPECLPASAWLARLWRVPLLSQKHGLWGCTSTSIVSSSFPKGTMYLMFPVLRALKQECSANFAITEFSEVRGARDLSHKPAALRLLDFPRRLYPRPHDLAVLRCPSPCARWRVVLIVDHRLQVVDLLLGQLQSVHERVSHGILLPQVPAHDGRAFGRVVRRAHGVLGVLQVPDVKPLIHPVRRPGEEDELFPEGIKALDLGEHACGGCRHELLLEAVSRYDLRAGLLHRHRPRLAAEDDLRIGAVKLVGARHVHVGRDRHTLLSLAQ